MQLQSVCCCRIQSVIVATVCFHDDRDLHQRGISLYSCVCVSVWVRVGLCVCGGCLYLCVNLYFKMRGASYLKHQGLFLEHTHTQKHSDIITHGSANKTVMWELSKLSSCSNYFCIQVLLSWSQFSPSLTPQKAMSVPVLLNEIKATHKISEHWALSEGLVWVSLAFGQTSVFIFHLVLFLL